MLRYVYLAGPIAGCTELEANDWRHWVSVQLAYKSQGQIRGINPLRCEPIMGDRYDQNSNPDPKFGTMRAIAAKNRHDVRNADVVLAFLPDRKGQHDERPSYGTICEIVWAAEDGKMVVVVSDDPEIQTHPVINANCGWMLSTIDEGIEVIMGILGDYLPQDIPPELLTCSPPRGILE